MLLKYPISYPILFMKNWYCLQSWFSVLMSYSIVEYYNLISDINIIYIIIYMLKDIIQSYMLLNHIKCLSILFNKWTIFSNCDLSYWAIIVIDL